LAESDLAELRQNAANICDHMSFEYVIKKEKKMRKCVNTAKGYKRAWVSYEKMKKMEYEGNWIENDKDEEFEWCDVENKKDIENTYFMMVNNDRRTLEAGEQIFYSYGRRNNAHLMLHYSFCFPNNKYDTYHLYVKKCKFLLQKPSVESIIDYDAKRPDYLKIPLKTD
jgi:hypothetical protein